MTAASIKFHKQFIYPIQAYFYNRRLVRELIKDIRTDIKDDLIKSNRNKVNVDMMTRKVPKSPLTILDIEDTVKRYFEKRGFIIKVIHPFEKTHYYGLYSFEWEISLPD